MSRLLSLIRAHKLMSALIGGTLAADAVYYGLHNTRQSYRAYSVSCTQPGSTEMLSVSSELRSLLRTAGDRLGIEPAELNRLRLFVTRGIDPVRMGRLSLSGFQAFLGLPEHFGYSARDSEQRHSFFFADRPLSLNTKKGRQLFQDCLLLTDEEKGFALARELAYLTSLSAHVPPLVGTLASAGFTGTVFWLQYRGGQALMGSMMRSKSSRRSFMTSFLVGATVILWGFMAHQWHAAYRKSLDARVDRRAAAAFPSGAVTFYEKQVRRNTLIRAMLGDSLGKKYFTIKGNEVHYKLLFLLSDPFLPVNQRWSKLRYDQTIATRETAAVAASAK